MFVLNPDPYSTPSYRIGPFRTSDMSINNQLPKSDLIDDYFNIRFPKRHFTYTENGRQAINIALSSFDLIESDVVTILTTTNNFYISGCVTKEVEKFCKWSRELTPETKVLFVNHEFGYPYHDLHNLKKHNLPIIEDCAGSFFSQDIYDSIGNIGDYVIYSFPKMFPIQIGGLLVSNGTIDRPTVTPIGGERLRYIKNVLSFHIISEHEIAEKRFFNYDYLKSRFESLGFRERFAVDRKSVPAVFMFRTDGQSLDLPEMKNYFYAHGIQCSVFYGEETFFVPVHQSLNEYDMQYFYVVMKSFINKS